MSLNRFFRKLYEKLDLERDPLGSHQFDPTIESDQKLLEDYRLGHLTQTELCFTECVDQSAMTRGLSSAEERCVRRCVERNVAVYKKLMVMSTKAAEN